MLFIYDGGMATTCPHTSLDVTVQEWNTIAASHINPHVHNRHSNVVLCNGKLFINFDL